MTNDNQTLLAMHGIAKRFPGVQALAGVDFDVRPGEVHALVGENGAGKSTLMHILAGVCQPDFGRIDFGGQTGVRIPDERAAQGLGISIVFQERSLFGPLSVAENIFAGRQPADRWGRIDRRALRAESARLLAEVGLMVDAATPVSRLSCAQQQMVEIAKALSLAARLIIFDEPTAALTATETQSLFAVIERLTRQGAGVVYISHRLEEVFRIADRVTVLKDGQGRGTCPVGETNPRELVAKMVGREWSHTSRPARVSAAGPVRLEVRSLADRARDGSTTVLRDVSFSAASGEVLVLAGLAGAGRTETALSIFGARPRAAGEIRIDGRPISPRSPAEAIAAGIGYLPEDRKDAGLFLEMSIAANIAAARLSRFGGWWLDDHERDRVAAEYCHTLRIAARAVSQPVVSLSGGNQQKVVLVKWLLLDPAVLLVDEPTRGVDVGAKAEVHHLLFELARRGTAVVVISSDLPEVLALADRVIVMRAGRIAGELARAEASEQRIMQLAAMDAPRL